MFPGATAERDEAAYVLVGAPLDVSTTFQPGTRFGPDRIRLFSRSFEDYDHRSAGWFSELGVCDEGDLHAWDDAPDYVDFLEGTLRDVVDEDAVPLLIGGEHTVTVAGVRAVEPDVYVCLDAHLDLRERYDGNDWSHSTVTRRALDVADEAVVVGARAGCESEWERAAGDDVTVIPPGDVDWWIETVRDGATFSDRSVYLSVDVDAADPGFAPGTGTMEPFGLTPGEMRDVVRLVAPEASGFDVVEVNDRDDGQAATLAGKLLREFVFAHASRDG